MTRFATDLQLSIFTRLSEAQSDWQQLKGVQFGNPYHTYDWLNAWVETLGNHLNVAPVIVVARQQEKPVLWLPLGLERTAGVTTLSFLGYQHGNQNTGCWEKSLYDRITADEVAELLKTICQETGADLLKLQNVPRSWHDRGHPLVLDGATASPSPVFARKTGSDFEQLFKDTHSKSARKNLLRKERHLQAAGGYRVARAETPAEIKRGFEAFLKQRALRSAEAGIPNVFDEPAARHFLGCLLGLTGNASSPQGRMLDLWYLETGGAIRSTYLCAELTGTLYAYSNSIAHDDMLPNSPGLVLIKEIIAHVCGDPGLEVIDLGLGEERYKTGWAEPVPLMDSFRSLTVKGKMVQGLVSGRLKAKTAIRNSAVLWPLVRRLRKWKAGFSGKS